MTDVFPHSPYAHWPANQNSDVELVQVAAGTFAESLLVDLDADVVKIERRDVGDDMRQ